MFFQFYLLLKPGKQSMPGVSGNKMFLKIKSLSVAARGDDSSLPVCSVSCTVHLQLFRQDQGDDSSLPVCSVSCTVHLQLFTNNDILQFRPESTYNNKYAARSRYISRPIQLVKDQCIVYIITLYIITSLVTAPWPLILGRR